MSRDQHYRAIWKEGFVERGHVTPAALVGVAIGTNFADACRAYAEEHPLWGRHFDPSTLTHAGVRLLDTFTEAFRRYG